MPELKKKELFDYIANVNQRLEEIRKQVAVYGMSVKTAQNKVIYTLESRAKWMQEDINERR